MDEAQTYQRRLQAIVEKRRLEEEEDKAKREKEEEKFRQDRLKRKSLRDKWLMEAAPLSPSSLDNQNPFSPPPGSQVQNMEGLESGSLQSEEKQHEQQNQMGNGQMEGVKVAEEALQVVLQNGDDSAAASETSENDAKKNQSVAADALTNGGEKLETNDRCSESVQNGPAGDTGAAKGGKPEPQVAHDVAEPGQVANVGTNAGLEDDGGTLVMRAECVFITDDGEDGREEFRSHDVHLELTQPHEVRLMSSEAGGAAEEAGPGATEPAGLTSEVRPAAEGDGSTKTSGSADGETGAEASAGRMEEPAPAQLPVPAAAPDATREAVGTTPSAPGPESGIIVAVLGSDGASKSSNPFQNVPRGEAPEGHKGAGRQQEQQPLLQNPAADKTGAAGGSGAGSESGLGKAGQPEGAELEEPKRKTCQCCSVM